MRVDENENERRARTYRMQRRLTLIFILFFNIEQNNLNVCIVFLRIQRDYTWLYCRRVYIKYRYPYPKDIDIDLQT